MHFNSTDFLRMVESGRLWLPFTTANVCPTALSVIWFSASATVPALVRFSGLGGKRPDRAGWACVWGLLLCVFFYLLWDATDEYLNAKFYALIMMSVATFEAVLLALRKPSSDAPRGKRSIRLLVLMAWFALCGCGFLELWVSSSLCLPGAYPVDEARHLRMAYRIVVSERQAYGQRGTVSPLGDLGQDWVGTEGLPAASENEMTYEGYRYELSPAPSGQSFTMNILPSEYHPGMASYRVNTCYSDMKDRDWRFDWGYKARIADAGGRALQEGEGNDAYRRSAWEILMRFRPLAPQP